MDKTIRRIAVLLSFCLLLFPLTASGNSIYLLTNQYGSVTLTNAGIVSTGSELTGYRRNWKQAPPGHDLGSISFSTGALLQGSLLGGGEFSDIGSSFIATGFGQYGVPNGTIFSGSFFGPIVWTLVSQTSSHDVFNLSGNLEGMLFNGRLVSGTTVQTIDVTQNLQGKIHAGHTALGSTALIFPEPPTSLLFATGLAFIVGAMRRKLFGA